MLWLTAARMSVLIQCDKKRDEFHTNCYILNTALHCLRPKETPAFRGMQLSPLRAEREDVDTRFSNDLVFKAPSQKCEKRLLALSCPSVRPSVRPSPAWNNSVPSGRIFMKFDM